MRGTVLHCSRFGAVVRLEDGRFGLLPADGSSMSDLRRAITGGRRPQMRFAVEEERGRRVRLALADPAPDVPADASSSLEKKIIDFLRQTAEWDHRASVDESPVKARARAREREPYRDDADERPRPRRRS